MTDHAYPIIQIETYRANGIDIIFYLATPITRLHNLDPQTGNCEAGWLDTVGYPI